MFSQAISIEMQRTDSKPATRGAKPHEESVSPRKKGVEKLEDFTREKKRTKSSLDDFDDDEFDFDDDEYHLYIPKNGQSGKLMRVILSEHPEIKKYLRMDKPELQKWLRHNGQLVTGRKHELLLRCVDGQINGRIPGCPKCHEGQMQYDYTEDVYVCNGYFDKLSRTPIRCGHTQKEVERGPWHDLEKDPPVNKGHENQGTSDEGRIEPKHHKEHMEHQHKDHNCKVEANHPLVDLLEDMAYYHSVLRDENWGFRARAFISAARAVEGLEYEVKDARKLEKEVDRIGSSSAEAMQAFLDSGKKSCSQLDHLKSAAARHEKQEKHQA